MCGHPEYETATKCIDSLALSVHPKVHENFFKLCKLAYSGIVGTRDQVQLIFQDLPSDFDDLGFMDSVTELYVTQGAVSSYNFLHLTFQEFFAAIHISTMSVEEQLKHFQRHKEGRLKMVLRFLAGLKKLNCFSKETHNQLLTPSEYEGHSSYLMSCDVSIDIDHVNWMFESQSCDVIKYVLGQKTVEFDNSDIIFMPPLEYYSLGYCIVHSQCQWVLKLRWDELDEEDVKMLAAGVNTRHETSGRVVGLMETMDIDGYCDVYISTVDLNKLYTEWKSVLNLHQLSLEPSEPCDDMLWPKLSTLRVLKLGIRGEINRRLDTLLPHLSLESLTFISIDNGTVIVYDDCVAIEQHIRLSSSLKEMCIIESHEHTRTCIRGEKGVEIVTSALAGNHSLPLETLILSCECVFTDTAVQSVAQFITNTTTLQHISLSYCTFSVHGLIILTRALQHNSSLLAEELEDLNTTVNGSSEGNVFAQLLIEYPDIVNSLNWDEFVISGASDAGAVAMAQALHHNSTLEWLFLSNNSISDVGAAALAQALHHNSTLSYLYLSNNGISDAGAVAMAQALHHNSTLKELDLSNNNISDDGAVAMAQALHHNSTLKELDLSNNNISDDGAVAMAQALHHNSTLEQLDLSNGNDGALEWSIGDDKLYLSNNSISDDGAVALAQALPHNSTIKRLYLSNNSISDAGAVAMAQALQHNSTIKRLYLSNNSISDAGAVALAQALHENSTLSHLYLSNNSISDDGAVAMAQALHHNSTLEELDLSNNSISDDGAVAMAQALHHNSTLEELDLSNNSISDDGAVAMAQALQHNSTLSYLYLSNNSISDDGAVDLAQALHHNSAMWQLDLSGNDGIGEEGTHQLVQALTVNTSIREYCLILPRICEGYATQCARYQTVKNRIKFHT